MSKQIPINPKISNAIKLNTGDDNIDMSKLAVFEAKAVSTEPLSKNKGIFAGGKLSKSMLLEMANHANTPQALVPMQIMHDTSALPSGRVFSGSVMDMPNGESELRVQFYLPNDRQQFISDINNAILDEVSVGVIAKEMKCSACGFDYRGPDATFDNLWQSTCNNGHTIGEDGTHLVMNGLDQWSELSLVNKGAANNAKIMPNSRQALNLSDMTRLAAQGIQPTMLMLRASNTIIDPNTNTKGDTNMEFKELLASLEAKSATLTEQSVKIAKLEMNAESKVKEYDAVKAELSAKTTELETLKASQDSSKVELAANLELANTKLSSLTIKLKESAKACLVAANDTTTTLSDDPLTLLELIESKGVQLHQLFASGGKSQTHVSDKPAGVASSLAFKSKK